MRQLARVIRWGGILPVIFVAAGCPRAERQYAPEVQSRFYVQESPQPSEHLDAESVQPGSTPENGAKSPMVPDLGPKPSELTPAPAQSVGESAPQDPLTHQSPNFDPFAPETPGEKTLPITETVAKEKLTSLRARITRDAGSGDFTLNLASSGLKDEDLIWITHLPGVKHLDLSGTGITERGLAKLSPMPALELLNLSNTGIGDTAVPLLTKLPHLKFLVLNGTKVTDRSLTTLALRSELKGLSLLETSLSAEAVAEFKRLHPKCTVIHRGKTDPHPTPKETRSRSERLTPEGLPGKINQWQSLEESADSGWDSLSSTAPSEPDAETSEADVPKTKPVLMTADWQPLESLEGLPAEPEAAPPADAAEPAEATDPQAVLETEWLAPSFLSTVSDVYLQRGEVDKAVHVLQQALRLHPEDSQLHHQLGIAVGRTGDLNTSFLAFQKVHGEAAAHYNLGIIVYENALNTSRDHFQKALTLDPTLVEAKTWLRHLGAQQGQRNEPQIVPAASSATKRQSAPSDGP